MKINVGDNITKDLRENIRNWTTEKERIEIAKQNDISHSTIKNLLNYPERHKITKKNRPAFIDIIRLAAEKSHASRQRSINDSNSLKSYLK